MHQNTKFACKKIFLGKCLFEYKISFAVEIKKTPDILGQK